MYQLKLMFIVFLFLLGTGYAFVIYNETMLFENLNATSLMTNDHFVVPLSQDQQDMSISCKSQTEIERNDFLETSKPNEDLDVTEDPFNASSEDTAESTTETSGLDFTTEDDFWDRSKRTTVDILEQKTTTEDDFWSR